MRVRARIDLLATADGGRATPVRSDYRPNHDLWANGNMHIGRIFFEEGRWLLPGESIEAVVDFFDAPGLAERLAPGSEWRIKEGSRLVGHGAVLEVLD